MKSEANILRDLNAHRSVSREWTNDFGGDPEKRFLAKKHQAWPPRQKTQTLSGGIKAEADRAGRSVFSHGGIKQVSPPVVTVELGATKARRLVFLLVANRPIRYGRNYSRIIYIGATGGGVSSVASSASIHIRRSADDMRGIQRIDGYIVWPRPKSALDRCKTIYVLHVLERALVLRFCAKYGSPPILNGIGHSMKVRREFEIFRRDEIDRIINAHT